MEETKKYADYRIGNCCFRVQGEKPVRAVKGLSGFGVFAIAEQQKPEFELLLDESKEVPAGGKKLYESAADRVRSIFYMLPDGHLLELHHEDGCSLYMRSVTGAHCLCLQGDLSPQLLRFALWIGYGLMTVHSRRIAVHSSCIVRGGKAFLFLGESGTGKSTQASLWKEHISGAVLLNDDSPIVVAEKEEVWVYGSPWSGKTPCYKQERYPLGGCIRLLQAPYNRIWSLPRLQAFAAIHPSCPPEFAYDGRLYDGITDTLDRILSCVPFYRLECLPDKGAALLTYTTLFGKDYEKDSE